ncbi:hypothetical protein [Cyclobacterium jeungdonense]|uniref:Uncharacterized protein n=1 Tax=Cyclobacterium jeungdonense TaxID=708087 RepID=A0ABT8CA03_9BACT|nr:hypothetical protein [Cyclobacterium jeungdonense]MDN3688501.1 hypothetical protein [Cyclobacterium jeungdonense]
MKNRNAIIWLLWIGLAGAWWSCEGLETPDPIAQPSPGAGQKPHPETPQGELKISSIVLRLYRNVGTSPHARLSAQQLKQATITIRGTDGSETAYKSTVIQVEEKEGHYLTEKIFLPEGAYEVISFYVMGEGNSVAEAAPQKTSPLGKESNLALPLAFDIVSVESEEEPVTQLSLEVISTQGKSPADFGLQSFSLEVVGPISFYVALVSDLRLMDFLPGTVEVSVLEDTLKWELSPGINPSIPLPLADKYTLTVSSTDWKDYSKTFSLEELLLYSSNPLIIKMEGTERECPGGSVSGNIILQSQTQVNEWPVSCYDGIKGDLIIESTVGNDAIIDLSPLEVLQSLDGALTIRNNPKLVSLEGLGNIKNIPSLLDISNNPRLETLNGLPDLTTPPPIIFIKENHSLINLEGLNQMVVGNWIEITSNNQIKNFRGLEQLSRVDKLILSDNENLESFEGLSGLREIGLLEISNQSRISSFEAFQNGIETLNSLSLSTMSGIKTLEGLFSPSGKVDSRLNLQSTSLQTLKGLGIAPKVRFDIQIRDNYSLENLDELAALTHVDRRFTIEGNYKLKTLSGLENLVSVGVGDGSENALQYPLVIQNNDFLANFCELTKLLETGSFYKLVTGGNYYDPKAADILSGDCIGDYSIIAKLNGPDW